MVSRARPSGCITGKNKGAAEPGNQSGSEPIHDHAAERALHVGGRVVQLAQRIGAAREWQQNLEHRPTTPPSTSGARPATT